VPSIEVAPPAVPLPAAAPLVPPAAPIAPPPAAAPLIEERPSAEVALAVPPSVSVPPPASDSEAATLLSSDPLAALSQLGSGLVDKASLVIEREMVPVVLVSVLLPFGLFGLLIVSDLLKALAGLFSSDESAASKRPPPAEALPDGNLPVPRDTFGEELSVWPALLELQDSLAAMSPEERRRIKLETGTNWPPRTSTVAGDGYTFFNGPTPLTGTQPGLPGFGSREDLSGVSVPMVLKVLGGVGGASLLGVVAVLVTGGF